MGFHEKQTVILLADYIPYFTVYHIKHCISCFSCESTCTWIPMSVEGGETKQSYIAQDIINQCLLDIHMCTHGRCFRNSIPAIFALMFWYFLNKVKNAHSSFRIKAEWLMAKGGTASLGITPDAQTQEAASKSGSSTDYIVHRTATMWTLGMERANLLLVFSQPNGLQWTWRECRNFNFLLNTIGLFNCIVTNEQCYEFLDLVASSWPLEMSEKNSW